MICLTNSSSDLLCDKTPLVVQMSEVYEEHTCIAASLFLSMESVLFVNYLIFLSLIICYHMHGLENI